MSERSEIKRDGAKAQKNSGRGQYQKGDAKWKKFLVDYKESKVSFTLNKDVWAKICTDTFKVSREMHPALKLIIGEESKVRLGIIEWTLLEELIEFWEENHG
jgi:DNA-directed RNA polymerase subunit E'/Rpb7